MNNTVCVPLVLFLAPRDALWYRTHLVLYCTRSNISYMLISSLIRGAGNSRLWDKRVSEGLYCGVCRKKYERKYCRGDCLLQGPFTEPSLDGFGARYAKDRAWLDCYSFSSKACFLIYARFMQARRELAGLWVRAGASQGCSISDSISVLFSCLGLLNSRHRLVGKKM